MSKCAECSHTLRNGLKCHAAALRGKPFCYHHARLHFQKPVRRKTPKAARPSIADVTSLQIAVAKALTALSSPFTDTRRAGLLLYGLNIAARLTKCAPVTVSGDAPRQSQNHPTSRPRALTPDH
jgi:hypothetical protein